MLLLLAAGATAFATNLATEYLAKVESSPTLPFSIPRTRLAAKEGLYFRLGAERSFTGWMIDPATNGTIKLRSEIVRGKLDGVSEGYFPNGTLELREFFRRGVPHGQRTTWHPNGQIRSEGELVNGLQHGLYQQWYENGKLAVQANFHQGKPHGMSYAWHPSGYLKAQAMLIDGEPQLRETFVDGARLEPTLTIGQTTFVPTNSRP